MSRASAGEARKVLHEEWSALDAEQMHAGRRIKWTLHPREVLAAWVAEMDFSIAEPIREALREQIEADGVGYPRLPIDPRLREAFLDWQQQRHGWQPEPRSVFAMVNVLQGIDAAILLHSEPGDGVLLLTPIYGPFHQAVDRTGRQRVESRLVPVADETRPNVVRYEIDWDDVEQRLSTSGCNTKLLLLSHPHNPTGRVLHRDELQRLGEVAIRHDLVVVSDEIHADLVLDAKGEHEHIPFASLDDEVAAHTLTLSSATKAFNLAGLPMALAVFGSEELKRKHLTLPPHLIGHGGPLGLTAAITAWTHPGCAVWIDALSEYLRGNREFLFDTLARDLPEVRVASCEATYLAWLDFSALNLPAGQDQKSAAGDFFLQHARVALSHGREFHAAAGETRNADCFVRLNFATSRLLLEQILERMTAAVRSPC